MDISSLKKYSSRENNLESKINSIKKEIDNTLQTLREIATALRPGIIDSLGLIPAIKWLVKEFNKKTGIKCHLEINDQDQKVNKNISICYFRICQESLTNISKHAKANEIKLKIIQKDKELLLEISDNGKGMTSEKLKNPFSMGLLGMRERSKIIGADLNITSQENIGTTIQLKVNTDGQKLIREEIKQWQ